MGILPLLFASAFCAESSISALRHHVVKTFPSSLVESGHAALVTANCQNDRQISGHVTNLDVILAVDNAKLNDESPDREMQSAIRE